MSDSTVCKQPIKREVVKMSETKSHLLPPLLHVPPQVHKGRPQGHNRRAMVLPHTQTTSFG